MTLAVHQPNFLPWVGFFSKMAASDVFVILDTVQFPRGKNVGNRAKVRGANGDTELVVPVSVPKGNEGKVPYRKLELAEGKWRKKVLRTLEMNYKKAPFFEELFPFLKELIGEEDFCGMNIAFIREMRDRLGLSTGLFLLSEFEDVRDERQERILDLCSGLGADRYLSGLGAKKYNQPELFEEKGVELAYHRPPEYGEPALDEAVEAGLSLTDPLFRIGAERCGEILRGKASGSFS